MCSQGIKMNNKFNLPKSIEKLGELSYNLWFSWNPDMRDLFREIDLDLWRACARNPIEFLMRVDPLKIQKFADDPTFVDKVKKCWDRFSEYMNNQNTTFAKNYPKMQDHLIAYFSAEYGLHESLPNYAGGLGILAGDHAKSASDLGLPFVAVGLMYQHAYFHQHIDETGNQSEVYNELDLERLPIQLVRDDHSEVILVSVPLLDREVFLKIWHAKVGRVSLYLLDTTVDQNSNEDKDIIHSLYGGSRDTRIRQEIILGIGGMRALRKMNLNPTVFHMNEGHSAFLGLERLSELMNEGLDYKTAIEFVRSTTVFTTHTPIPAGNEEFDFDMIEKYFQNMWPQLEISHDMFFDLGRNTNIHQHENFSLTVLAFNLSTLANGVSKLHGEVSRSMWQKVWPGIPPQEIPIGHITNGVHTFTWLHRKMLKLFDKEFGPEWRENIRNQNFWDKIMDLPDDELWEIKRSMKNDLVTYVRRHYAERVARYGEDHAGFPLADEILKEDVLTIGFARRFAPYKRATLFFRDLERAKRILNNPERPLQLLFAGKAHPANDAGKDLIKTINEISKQDGFRGKVIFVEDYNMNNARALITGVDVWLNNPRRPLEASGTSGQKVPINMGINMSVLDGWWIEGYNGQNGWAIGQDRQYADNEQQDSDDSESLYSLLENELAPLYYQQDNRGIPTAWIQKAKMSFQSTISQFSAHRMVWSYLNMYYLPGMKRGEHYQQEEYRELHKFSRWKNRMQRMWKKVTLSLKNGTSLDEDRRIFSAGETREISLLVHAGGLNPKDLRVELILERQDTYMGHQAMKVIEMGLVASNKINGDLEYRAHITADNDGSYRFNCRVLPLHPDMFHIHETRLIKWLD
jgi:starch phosphorylase